MKSFLKWVGSKNKLIEQYQPYFPQQQFETYYEPFLGGGSVFFHLKQQHPNMRAVLSDVNEKLINTYKCVRDLPLQLISLLEEHERYHQKYPNAYYSEQRDKFNRDIGMVDVERAGIFIYLNKTCYNGLYRENSKGEFNVPMGKYKNPNICDRESIMEASALLQKVDLVVASFEVIVEHQFYGNELVYFDPPYHPISHTSNFTHYSKQRFEEEKQFRIRDVFATLAEWGVTVMLSNSKCDFIKQIYSSDRVFVKCPKIVDISASRNINSDASKRGKIGEYLVVL